MRSRRAESRAEAVWDAFALVAGVVLFWILFLFT